MDTSPKNGSLVTNLVALHADLLQLRQPAGIGLVILIPPVGMCGGHGHQHTHTFLCIGVGQGEAVV